MPFVLRDFEMTRVWALRPGRASVIGNGRDCDVKVDDWTISRVDILPAGEGWAVRTRGRGWRGESERRILRVQDRSAATLSDEPLPLAPGDALFLGRESVLFFCEEEGDPAEIVEPMAAARPLFEAARAAIDAGVADWAERLTRRFIDCRETLRAEALADYAGAAALETTGLPGRRIAAVASLGELGRTLPATVRPLRVVLGDPDRTLRVGTARALARIGGIAVVDALAAALRDVDDRVFLTAIAAIERSRDPAFRQPLFEILRDAKGKRRQHLERALAGLAPG